MSHRTRLLLAPSGVLDVLQERFGELFSESPAVSGFTQTAASVLRTASGSFFVKAAPPGTSRTAIDNAVDLAHLLPGLSPDLVFSFLQEDWLVAVFELVPGEELARWTTHACI